jgi:hypothetical protein
MIDRRSSQELEAVLVFTGMCDDFFFLVIWLHGLGCQPLTLHKKPKETREEPLSPCCLDCTGQLSPSIETVSSPLEQWYELGPPGLVYSGTLVMGSPYKSVGPFPNMPDRKTYFRRVVLLGNLHELDGDARIEKLWDSFD